jgi:SAM-dependent methyltransferase
MTADPCPLAGYPLAGDDWGETVHYGPLVADENTLRLLGALTGRRVLLLGCGSGQPAAALSTAGARVIAVEPSPVAADEARRYLARRGLSVEVHERDLAELAFVRAETVDIMLSVFSLAGVADLTRVFRQVHRVLKSDSAIVVSLPHPMLSLVDAPADRSDPPRRYGEAHPVRWHSGEVSGVDHGHTIESLATALGRTGFRIENLLEPLANLTAASAADAYWRPAMDAFPVALIVRARKQGM